MGIVGLLERGKSGVDEKAKKEKEWESMVKWDETNIDRG